MPDSTEKVKEFFEQPSRYLGERFSIRVRAHIVRDWVGDRNNVSIADLGCGDGSISLPLLGDTNRITMVDLAENMLSIARANTPAEAAARVTYVNDDIQGLPLEPAFDVVLCVGVLAHVPSIEETIAKISAISKPGGKSIFQLTDHDAMLARLSRWRARRRAPRPGDDRGYATNPTTPKQIVEIANRNGLQLVAERRFSVILPLMRLMPTEWMYRYHLFSATNPALSRCGSEMMLCFEKRDG